GAVVATGPGAYLSFNNGSAWVDLSTVGLPSDAVLDAMGEGRAVLSPAAREAGQPAFWVVDLIPGDNGDVTVTPYALDESLQVVAASPETVLVGMAFDLNASAIDLTAELPELVPLKSPSWTLPAGIEGPEGGAWFVGPDGAHAVVYMLTGVTVGYSAIVPTPLDGTEGDPSLTVPGVVSYAGTADAGGTEYLVKVKTKGRSTYEFDYCRLAPGATKPACSVLKNKLKSSVPVYGGRFANFIEFYAGNDLYFSELPASGTGTVPAAKKVTGTTARASAFATAGTYDRPVVTDATAGHGGVFTVSAKGTAVSEPQLGLPTGPVVPDSLALSAGTLAGVDSRGVPGLAWQRSVHEGSMGGETRISQASGALVSAGRRAVNGPGGLVLTDQGAQVAKLKAWKWIDQLSGPYLLGSAKGSKATVLAGTKTVSFSRYDHPAAIFGSLVAAVYARGATFELRIYDIASGKPALQDTVSLDDFYEVDAVHLWGDQVAVFGYVDENLQAQRAVVTDWRTDTTAGTHDFPDGGAFAGLSDGVAVIDDAADSATWLAWKLGAGTTTELDGADADLVPALDASGRVAFATDSTLVVRQLGGTSAPRALWRSAAASFNAFAGDTRPWALAIDASAALPAGTLTIQGVDDAVLDQSVELDVDASNDGSLRLAWNGRLADGTFARAGTYTWSVSGLNGLTALDGSALQGELRVSNDPLPFPQATPDVLNRKPVVDTPITVDAGPSPADAVVAYQWYRGRKAIADATAADYTPTAADVGKTLRAKVSFTGSANYRDSSKYSKYTKKVAKANLVKGTVALDATAAQVDTPIRAELTGFGPDPVTPKYQWYRVKGTRTTSITRATADSYTPTAADVGYRLKVRVIGTKPGYNNTSTVYSDLSDAVLAGAYDTTPDTVQVAGTAEVGAVLTAGVVGDFVAAGGQVVAPTFAYQWYRVDAGGNVKITGATKKTYTPTTADVGQQLQVQ
ncbi:MAG: hypothetical protein KDB60_15045, partial [Propionibacteriaceae bacterium]|nr:hypothetical protein [Propionibacteriaceae bacterium]